VKSRIQSRKGRGGARKTTQHRGPTSAVAAVAIIATLLSIRI